MNGSNLNISYILNRSSHYIDLVILLAKHWLHAISDHKLSHSDLVHTILNIFGFQEGDGHLHIAHHIASCHDWGLLGTVSWHCGIRNQPCTRRVWTHVAQFVLSPLPRSPEMRRALRRLHSETEQIQQSPPGMTGMTPGCPMFRV